MKCKYTKIFFSRILYNFAISYYKKNEKDSFAHNLADNDNCLSSK